MRTTQTAWYIRSVFAVLGLILLMAWGSNVAHADSAQGAQVSIATNGQIIVRGAKVVSVSGTTVTASTAWGGTRILWTIQITGSTKLSPDIGSSAMVQKIAAGHTIGFTGTIDGGLDHPLVLASALRDEVLVQSSVSVLGTVESIDLKQGTFVLKTEDGESTILARAGTIMSRNGNYALIDGVQVGDSAKATGTFDATSDTLTADRVFLKSAQAPVAATQEPRSNVFASVMKWLQGSRGILSVRDR